MLEEKTEPESYSFFISCFWKRYKIILKYIKNIYLPKFTKRFIINSFNKYLLSKVFCAWNCAKVLNNLLLGANTCCTINLQSGKIIDFTASFIFPSIHWNGWKSGYLICMILYVYQQDSQNTYEDFGFERFNLLLSFLAEWRSSCSCRLFWGTAAMILKRKGKNISTVMCFAWITMFFGGQKGWSTVPTVPKVWDFFWSINCFDIYNWLHLNYTYNLWLSPE